MYIWQRPQWPNFRWDGAALSQGLANASHKQGHLFGKMHGLGFDLKLRAQLANMTEEVLKTSEIEGELLNPASVRSSLARRLGVQIGALVDADDKTEGVVAMTLDATQRHGEPLTPERLHGWQAALFPTGRSVLRRVTTGAWRDDSQGPMQVVSGPIGRERVHYEAPPAARLPDEMRRFLGWFAQQEPQNLLRAGLAHLWFELIHPYEDGNGRVGRAVAEQALSQLEASPQRFYSMSSQIRKERAAYYKLLEETGKGSLDVTQWLSWFLDCFSHAIDGAEETCAQVLVKANFWQKHQDAPFSERQMRVINRFLDDFEGKLTTKKWAAIGKCSVPTAQRDINELIERGVMKANDAGGRSTSYDVVLD